MDPYVGQIVRVKHDTGRTLLASQLVLNTTGLASPRTAAPALAARTPSILSFPPSPAPAIAGVTTPNVVRLSPAVAPQSPLAVTPRPAVGNLAFAPLTPPAFVDPARPVIITQFDEAAAADDVPSPAPIVLEEIIGNPIAQPVEGLPLPPGITGAITPLSDQLPFATPHSHGEEAPACDLCEEVPSLRQVSPQQQPRYFAYGEFLYLQPVGADVAHAQQQNGIGGAGTVPFGSIGTLSHSFDPGFRLGFGVDAGHGTAWEVSYAFFEASAANSLDIPNIVGGGGAVGSLVQHPQTLLTASTGPVTAGQGIDFQILDLVYRAKLTDYCGCQLNYSFGVQYGELEQSFNQNGVFGGGAGGVIDTSTAVDFEGGGFKAGLDGYRRLSDCGVVYGRASGALLAGEFDAQFTQLNTTTNVLLANAIFERQQIVPQLDVELGVAYLPQNRPWSVSVGYQFSNWFNVVTTPDFIDAVQQNQFLDLSDTITFHGIAARAEARW